MLVRSIAVRAGTILTPIWGKSEVPAEDTAYPAARDFLLKVLAHQLTSSGVAPETVADAIGITPAFLRYNNRGMAAVDQQISYKRELLSGDIVEVHSAILEIRERVIRFTHEMSKPDTGEVAATTVLTAVHLDKAARRACAFPAEVREKAASFQPPPTM